MDPTPKKSEVWWDEAEQILHVVSRGNFGKDDALRQCEQIKRIVLEHGGKVARGLANLEEADKASMSAQFIFADLMKSKMIAYQAFVGMKSHTKFLVQLIDQLSDAKNQNKFFDTNEEAIAWLKTCS